MVLVVVVVVVVVVVTVVVEAAVRVLGLQKFLELLKGQERARLPSGCSQPCTRIAQSRQAALHGDLFRKSPLP